MEPVREMLLAEDAEVVMRLEGSVLLLTAKANGHTGRIPLSAAQRDILRESASPESPRVEAERRFLCVEGHDSVRRALETTQESPRTIEQHYILLDRGTKSALRVRKTGDGPLLTFKRGMGERKGEFEFPLDVGQFEVMRDFAELHTRFEPIEKQRITLPSGWEVDCFAHPSDSEIVAEFEFDPAAAVDPTALLAKLQRLLGGVWQDVTDDPRYTNASVAENGFPED